MITTFQLEEALRAIGIAEVYLGDPTVADGMVSLGLTEGEIGFEAPETPNVLTAPEQTGGIPHQATVTLESATLVVPVIVGDPNLWARISATGAKGGGHSTPQQVLETSALLIPKSEVGGGLSYGGGPPAAWARLAGNGVGAAAGALAAPQNAIWLWRCFVTRGRVPFRFQDGGKSIVEVRITGMIDVTKPEGQMVYTIGDPAAQGITGIVL